MRKSEMVKRLADTINLLEEIPDSWEVLNVAGDEYKVDHPTIHVYTTIPEFLAWAEARGLTVVKSPWFIKVIINNITVYTMI